MSKTVLNDLVNLENQTSSVNTINANNAVIETAFDNTLSRNGLSPNQMESTLDMNSNRIINLPEAVSTTEPITLTQINTIIASGQIPNGLVSVGVPVSAAMQPVVNASTIDVARSLLFINERTIEFYGGVADNTTDNSPAINAFIAANPTGGSLYLGKGTYKFVTGVSISLPNTIASYSLIGQGSEVTILSFPTTDGFNITYNSPFNSIHFSGFTMETLVTNTRKAIVLTQVGTLGVGGAAVGATSTLYDVTFRGDTYSGLYLWSTAVSVESVSNINFISCNFNGVYPVGIGVVFSSTASYFGVAYNFTDCNFTGLSIGINYGGTGGYIQGVTVSQCNFTGVDFGIVSGTSVLGLGQLAVNGCQFTAYLGGAVYQASPIPQTTLVNNTFLAGSPNLPTVSFINNDDMTITGNIFVSSTISNTQGVYVGTSTAGSGGIITGNIFRDYSIGVVLDTGSARISVQSNKYPGTGTATTNAGTNNVIGGGSA